MIDRGVFVAVVGPSGAGKDTLLAAARAALAMDAAFHFCRRIVTRSAIAAIEDHDSVSETDFETIAAGGGMLVSWQSHGLAYGLPSTATDALARGRIVVANVSRTVLPEIERRVQHVAVLNVTATPDVLGARLEKRGRERGEDIHRRLSRKLEVRTERAAVVVIDNSGEIAPAVDRFIRELRLLARSPGQIGSAR